VVGFAVLAGAYVVFVAFNLRPALNLWLLGALISSIAFPISAIGLTAMTFVPTDVELVVNLPTGVFLLIAAAVGQVVRIAVSGRRLSLPWPTAAVVAFTLITLANLLWVTAANVPPPRAGSDWAILFAGILACLLIATGPRAATATTLFVFAIGVAISAIAAVAAVEPGLFEGGPLAQLVRQGGNGRAMGSTHGANVLGVIAAMSFAYFAVRAASQVRRRDIVLGIAMAGACVPALYFTFSRSAALGLGIAVVLGLYMLGRRAAMVVAVILVAGVILLGPTLVANRLDSSSGRIGGSSDPRITEAQATSDRLRVRAWLAGVQMAIDRPITGVGFGRYPVLRAKYGGPPELHTPHSDYIRFFAETGVPGGVSFLVVLAGVAWSLKSTRDTRSAAALAAAITVFCVATQFNAQLYYLEASLPFWVAAGAAIHLRARDGPESPNAPIVQGVGRRPRVQAHRLAETVAGTDSQVDQARPFRADGFELTGPS
jgi:O-antigen ligase